MLPLKLSISGLYSYQKKQTIDFTALTDAGLFGIFGAVGSGKSSILEAIGFVLYGETERLNSRDKRSYNMLNLKSDKANIEFEFLNFEERKFKFVADWKRNKKRFEETSTIERLAYEWIGEQWIPLASADATALIGLTYENFRRTIIIPQGKFKEFLDLKGKDRSDMMKEIFHLQRFDLSAKVASAQSVVRTQLDQLKGVLSGFETISKIAITDLENEVAQASTILQATKTELEVITNEFQAMSLLKTNFEDLDKKKQILQGFLTQKPQMDSLQNDIETFEKTDKAFSILLHTLSNATATSLRNKEQLLLLEANKNSAEQRKKSIQTLLNDLQPQFDQLETSRSKVSDLESIEKIMTLQLDVDAIHKRSEVIEIQFAESEKKERETKLETEKIIATLDNLKASKLNSVTIGEVGNWFTKQEFLITQLNAKIDRIKIIREYLLKQKSMYSELGLPETDWKVVLDKRREAISMESKNLLETKTKLMVSKELAQFAHNLHEGENCPLCGSLEHPQVMQPEDVSEQFERVEASILKAANSDKEITILENKALKIERDTAHANEQLQLTLSEKEVLERDIKEHFSNFIWTNFSATDEASFLVKKQEQQQIEKSILETERKEKEIRTQMQQIAEQLKIQLQEKSNLAAEKAAKLGAISNELSQLKVLNFADYAHTAITTIQDEKVKLEAQNNQIAADYQENHEAVVALEKELAGLEASLRLITEQQTANEKVLFATQKELAVLLKIHQFDSVESVQLILSKTWDLEVEKARTTQFSVSLQVAATAVTEAEQLVMNQHFDATVFEAKANKIKIQKSEFDLQLGNLATLQDKLQRHKEALIEKEALLTEFEVLNARAANLVTLANMFSASGFVNYVSSIYLQNLSDVANVRFHRMTKNQLSLTINSNNEFEVIDYLNNGASRSVKTLSGGQSFQASLCLALALAESVQTLNKNDKNFFFIDEGFGTQDPESVAIVFETLQSLYKENRVVGIISHVTELQERIPRSINVIKDEETGSIVRQNWS